ncbi:MAG TPA: ThuA domain-containing protein [Chthonomonadaceae bacterium]|nr:ThuA domain-containing protein [Chthonomonadaceae bacterium]
MIRRSLLVPLLVLALALSALGARQAPPKIQVLILTGQHGHNWRETTPRLREILENTGRFEVRVTEEPTGAGPETFAKYDVLLLHYRGPRWGERTEKALLDFVSGGKGLIVYHHADSAFPDWPEYDKLIGAAWRQGAGHGPRHEFTVQITDKEHPITRGMSDFAHASDELYHGLTVQPTIHVLATAFSDPATGGNGTNAPMAYVQDYGKGRVFGLVLGHDTQAMDAGFASLLTRGAEWAATGKVTLGSGASQ